MNYKKLPFKTYTVMSNNLIQKLGCTDVYRAYVLLLTANKKTLTTDTTIEQLAFFTDEKITNYKGGQKTKSFNDKLRAIGEVLIQPKKGERIDWKYTDYIFSPVILGNYRRIGREFYDSYKDLDLKLKGFILKLFSAAEPHSYIINLSIRKLKELIHMSHGTISKYMKQLKELGLLEETKSELILKVKGLIIDLPKDQYVEETKALFEHMIAFNESKENPISKECIIYKKYKEKNFEDIKNMHNFMQSLENGLIGKKQELDNVEYPDIIL